MVKSNKIMMVNEIVYDFLDNEEVVFIEKLEAQADDVLVGKIKSILLEDLKNKYKIKLQRKGFVSSERKIERRNTN